MLKAASWGLKVVEEEEVPFVQGVQKNVMV